MSVFVIEPSCILWDKSDFKVEPTRYYNVAQELIGLIELIENEQMPILIRQQLLDEFIDGFPFCEVCDTLPQFQYILSVFYKFIADLNYRIIPYCEDTTKYLSTPSLNRSYYSLSMQNEVDYLCAAMFSNNDLKGIFALKSNWDNSEEVALENSGVVKGVSVLINEEVYNRVKLMNTRIFEPSPKHDPIRGWGSPFPWGCEFGQELLDGAVKAQGNSEAVYNYDKQNGIFVIFRITSNNVYHGYAVDEDEVPSVIKTQLLK